MEHFQRSTWLELLFFYVLDTIHSPAGVNGKIPIDANGLEIFWLESSYPVEVL